MADALYTARAHTTGGRQGGHARTDDGKLDVRIESPTELGGTGAGKRSFFVAEKLALD